MNPRTVRRRRAPWSSPSRTASVIGVAIGVHLVAITVVQPPPLTPVAVAAMIGTTQQPPEEFVQVDDTWFNLNCLQEVLIRRAVRSTWCAIVGQGSSCRQQAAQAAQVEQLRCSSVDVPAFMAVEPKPLVDEETFELAMLDLDDPTAKEQEQEEEPETTLLDQIKEKTDPANFPRPSGQVVDIPKPLDSSPPPPDTAYVAEFDSRVEKETRKFGVPDESGTQQRLPRKGPETTLTDKPPPDPAAVQAEPAPEPEGGSLGDTSEGEALAQALEPQPEGIDDGFDPKVPGLGPAWGMPNLTTVDRGPLGGAIGDDKAAGQGEGEGDGKGEAELTVDNLRLDEQALEKAAGGTYDYLRGVQEGEGTALNARRWKYASFFNRVKSQVAQNWHPEQAYRLRDPTGSVYGTKDRLTVLSISLEPNGALSRVVISQPSGVDFLDEEAIKAFQAAQPFPNPPSALVSGESRLITFQFGFMFEINSRKPWKVFRYRGY